MHFTRFLCSSIEFTAIHGENSSILLYMQSLGRSVGAQIIIDEVLASCSGGPRGNEQLRSLLTFVLKFCGSLFRKGVFVVLTLRLCLL